MQLLNKDKSNKTQYVRKSIISIGVIAFFIAAIIAFVMSNKMSSKVNVQKLDSGWDVIINDSIYENVTLSTFRIPETLKKGDTIILKTNLPEQLDSDSESVTFQAILTTLEARIDGNSIYTYGEEAYEKGFVGSGYHFIQLPQGSEGKEITFILKPSETGAFTNIVVPTVTPVKYTTTAFADKNLMNIFICIFLSMLGVIITIVGAIAYLFESNVKSLVVIGLLTTVAGVWSSCNTKIIQIFSIDLEMCTAIEYLSLYVAPVPLVILIIMVMRDDTAWKKKLLYGVLAVLISFDILSTILHFTGIAHFPTTLAIFHFLGFATIIILAIAGHSKFSNMDRTERVLTVAIVVLCVFAGLDILRFNYSKYMWPENEMLTNSILPLGMLVFVVLLVGSYIFYIYDVVQDSAEDRALAQMAYTDSLTGLYNRAKAEKKFAKLLKNKMDYFLINLDLNGLKKMNDKFGHAKGDLLITTFADILKECFSDIATVVRMGGDEFLVIIDARYEDKIKPALAKMIELEAEKSKETGMRIEASFGISSNIEDKSRGPEQVYSVADQRMYKMKQNTKAARRARAKAKAQQNQQ